jgi:hypothetical protein
VSIYVADETLASGFIARWGVGGGEIPSRGRCHFILYG